MKINGTFLLREVLDECILLPVGESALACNGMICLDPVGAEIWRALEDGRAEEEIVQVILERFEVDEQTARSDIAAFLNELAQEGLLA